jgi:hypothetical protein
MVNRHLELITAAAVRVVDHTLRRDGEVHPEQFRELGSEVDLKRATVRLDVSQRRSHPIAVLHWAGPGIDSPPSDRSGRLAPGRHGHPHAFGHDLYQGATTSSTAANLDTFAPAAWDTNGVLKAFAVTLPSIPLAHTGQDMDHRHTDDRSVSRFDHNRVNVTRVAIPRQGPNDVAP